MTKEDLMRMIDAANAITVAAQKHERDLELLLNLDSLPEDWMIGELFSPISQAMSNWRRLMAAMFPTPEDDAEQIAKLSAIVDSWDK